MRRELGQFLVGAGVAGLFIEGANYADVQLRVAPAIVRTFVPNTPTESQAKQAQDIINAYKNEVDHLGTQGKLAQVPAIPNYDQTAVAYDTRNKYRAAKDGERKVWQIHFPVEAVIAGVSVVVAAGELVLRRILIDKKTND